jgi:hypothetical protein
MAKPTSLEKTENRKWLLLRKTTWKSEARPPKHDCKARATDSSVRRKRKRRNVTSKRNEPSGEGKGKCTGARSRRRISSWNSNPRSKSRRLRSSDDDPMDSGRPFTRPCRREGTPSCGTCCRPPSRSQRRRAGGGGAEPPRGARSAVGKG